MGEARKVGGNQRYLPTYFQREDAPKKINNKSEMPATASLPLRMQRESATSTGIGAYLRTGVNAKVLCTHN